MKTRILTFGILLAFFTLVSCEKDKSLNVNSHNYLEMSDAELLPFFDAFVNAKTFLAEPLVFNVEDDTPIICGEPEVFELWYSQDFPYGTVTVSNDDEFLYIQYDVYKDLIEKGWGIHTTYLFLGDYNDLPYKEVETEDGKIITVIDWYGHNIERETYDDNPTSVVYTIPLNELPDCFNIATKVKLNNPEEGQNPNPRALVEINGLYSYPWQVNYEYCVRECEDCEGPGTGTQGYWHKVSHWEDWKISEITIGDILYSAEKATALIKEAGPGDKTYDMFAQLVAAKLNVMIGNCSYCIDDIIASADAWMADHPVESGVPADSDAWKEAEGWHTMLDDYNNGKLCAPHRD